MIQRREKILVTSVTVHILTAYTKQKNACLIKYTDFVCKPFTARRNIKAFLLTDAGFSPEICIFSRDMRI